MDPILAKYAIIGTDLDVMQNVRILVDDKNQIVEIEESNKNFHNNAVLIPGLFNAHVHAADINLRDSVSGSLNELVGKNGIKHNHLKNMTNLELNDALMLSFHEAIRSGTLGWSDFREGGLDGTKPYPLNNSKVHLAFGRPNQNELNQILQFPNIGIMDVNAYSENNMRKIAKKINRTIQKLFIHASESLRQRNKWISNYGVSDILWALDVLSPDAIIHATNADETDIEEMVKSNTGAVICLRSNKITNAGVPPVESLVESNLVLGIGTDNAMFNNLSVWDEMKSLKYLVEPERLISMATIEGALLCGVQWGLSKGNSNFLEIHVPNHIQVRDLKKWIVNNGTEKDILKVWR